MEKNKKIQQILENKKLKKNMNVNFKKQNANIECTLLGVFIQKLDNCMMFSVKIQCRINVNVFKQGLKR